MARQPNARLLKRGERRHYRNTLIILQQLARPSYIAQFRTTCTLATVLQFTCSGKGETLPHSAIQYNPSPATGNALRDKWKLNTLQPIIWSVNWHKMSAAACLDVGNHSFCCSTCAKSVFSFRKGRCVYIWPIQIKRQLRVLGKK